MKTQIAVNEKNVNKANFSFTKKDTGMELATFLGKDQPKGTKLEIMDSTVRATKVAFATTGDKVSICYVKVSGANIGVSEVSKRDHASLIKARLTALTKPAPKKKAAPKAKAKPAPKKKAAKAKVKKEPRKTVDAAHVAMLQKEANDKLKLPEGVTVALTPAMSKGKFVYLFIYAVRTADGVRQQGGDKKAKLNFGADGNMKVWLGKAQVLANDAVKRLADKPRKRSSKSAEVITNSKDTKVVSAKGSVEGVLDLLNNLDK